MTPNSFECSSFEFFELWLLRESHMHSVKTGEKNRRAEKEEAKEGSEKEEAIESRPNLSMVSLLVTWDPSRTYTWIIVVFFFSWSFAEISAINQINISLLKLFHITNGIMFNDGILILLVMEISKNIIIKLWFWCYIWRKKYTQ